MQWYKYNTVKLSNAKEWLGINVYERSAGQKTIGGSYTGDAYEDELGVVVKHSRQAIH